MPTYRLYSLNPFTGHFEGVEELHAADDAGATRLAQDRLGPKPLELWCDARKVARFDALPEALAYAQTPATQASPSGISR